MAFAEFERDMISERTKGKAVFRRPKKGIGRRTRPVGIPGQRQEVIGLPEEADLVRKMFKYYLEEPSSNKVSDRLNTEGYTMKTRTSKGGKTSGGTRFTKESVVGILRNTIYTGVVRFKKELFEGIHRRFVDKTTFQKCKTGCRCLPVMPGPTSKTGIATYTAWNSQSAPIVRACFQRFHIQAQT